MRTMSSNERFLLRRAPLPACLAAALALAIPAFASAADMLARVPQANGSVTPLPFFKRLPQRAYAPPAVSAGAAQLIKSVVSTCTDDAADPDNLRSVVKAAGSGSMVDLSGLKCSSITLTRGAIAVNVTDLVIQGPGANALTIDAGQIDRAFVHYGKGTLALNDLTVANGAVVADRAYGGCIYSHGNLRLTRSAVTGCAAMGQTKAVGGGIVVYDKLSLYSSSISNNLADAAIGKDGDASGAGGAIAHEFGLVHSVVSGNTVHVAAGSAYGGGIISYALTSKYSTVSDNKAVALSDGVSDGIGGGALVAGSLFMLGSTIDHNEADSVGGVFVNSLGGGTVTIAQSTISSNKGNLSIGGIASTIPFSIDNSTVAFNSAGPFGVGGLGAISTIASLQSSIFAGNSPTDVDGAATLAGGNNLVENAGPGVTLPLDTLAADPKLEPLAHNGGSTRTHMLGTGSPAIDAGINVNNLPADQRQGTYARVVGNGADIGAVEFDDDHIFADDFGN